MFSIVPTPGEYIPELQQWRPIQRQEVECPSLTHLSIATLNIWFDHAYFAERCAAILALLADHRPDIITLQEVTPDFLQRVLHTSWIQADYCVSDMYGDSVDPYGVLMLSRLPVEDWQVLPLPSAMGRHLVMARSVVNTIATTVASVHLESTASSAPIRAKQLARIFPFLQSEQQVILTGDFNLCSTWEENNQLDSAYHDVWPLLHPSESGYTVDTERNVMRLLHTNKHKQVRFDRMLVRAQRPGWRATTMTLFGDHPISSTTPHIYPSDHFGLISRFVWQP